MSNAPSGDRIELLSVDILDTHRDLVQAFEDLSQRIRYGFGWHYKLDLAWAVHALRDFIRPGATILDAGAGRGLMQWYLAERGADVISVDVKRRDDLPRHIQMAYNIAPYRSDHFVPCRLALADFLPSRDPRRWTAWPAKLSTALKRLFGCSRPAQGGTVLIYNQDLGQLSDIPDGSVDAVVSISALEHNAAEVLRRVVVELLRTLKPGGRLVATLGAAKDCDWLHEPSSGWCYTERTLREVFDLPPGCPSNYSAFDTIFDQLCHCAELRDQLDATYRTPGRHGMPKGVWDPEYAVVGVIKTKPRA